MWLPNFLKRATQIKRNDISIFFTQFTSLLQAGVPLLQALETIEQCQSKLPLQRMIFSLRCNIASGMYLSQAFKPFEFYLDTFSLHLIEIGERMGKLETMLTLIIKHQEKNEKLIRKIQNTLIYPTILIITAICLILFMFIVIIPKFSAMYQETHTKLPCLTRIIFTLANNMQHSILLLVFIIVAIICLMKYKRISIPHKYSPLFIWRNKIRIIFFARNLAHTLSAGLPLIDAIELSGSKLFYSCNSPSIPALINHVKNGMSLHTSLQSLKFFPVLFIHMVKIGEECGRMDEMLHKCADLLEIEINHWMVMVSRLVEPLIMLGLGVLIGGLVIAMYLPIFNLGTLF